MDKVGKDNVDSQEFQKYNSMQRNTISSMTISLRLNPNKVRECSNNLLDHIDNVGNDKDSTGTSFKQFSLAGSDEESLFTKEIEIIQIEAEMKEDNKSREKIQAIDNTNLPSKEAVHMKNQETPKTRKQTKNLRKRVHKNIFEKDSKPIKNEKKENNEEEDIENLKRKIDYYKSYLNKMKGRKKILVKVFEKDIEYEQEPFLNHRKKTTIHGDLKNGEHVRQIDRKNKNSSNDFKKEKREKKVATKRVKAVAPSSFQSNVSISPTLITTKRFFQPTTSARLKEKDSNFPSYYVKKKDEEYKKEKYKSFMEKKSIKHWDSNCKLVGRVYGPGDSHNLVQNHERMRTKKTRVKREQQASAKEVPKVQSFEIKSYRSTDESNVVSLKKKSEDNLKLFDNPSAPKSILSEFILEKDMESLKESELKSFTPSYGMMTDSTKDKESKNQNKQEAIKYNLTKPFSLSRNFELYFPVENKENTELNEVSAATTSTLTTPCDTVINEVAGYLSFERQCEKQKIEYEEGEETAILPLPPAIPTSVLHPHPPLPSNSSFGHDGLKANIEHVVPLPLRQEATSATTINSNRKNTNHFRDHLTIPTDHGSTNSNFCETSNANSKEEKPIPTSVEKIKLAEKSSSVENKILYPSFQNNQQHPLKRRSNYRISQWQISQYRGYN